MSQGRRLGAGKLRWNVQLLARAASERGTLNDFVSGAERRCCIEVVAAEEAQSGDLMVGVAVVRVTFRMCPETKALRVRDRLKELSGPGNLNRIFDIAAPGEPSDCGTWISFEVEAGLVDETDN